MKMTDVNIFTCQVYSDDTHTLINTPTNVHISCFPIDLPLNDSIFLNPKPSYMCMFVCLSV